MSAFVEAQTNIVDEADLLDALDEMGFKPEAIEQHAEAQPLYGYRGDRRSDTANVIIRRNHIGRLSNDIGWRRENDGTYTAVVSKFDSKKRGEVWEGHLDRRFRCTENGFAAEVAARAAACRIERKARKRGQHTKRERRGGKWVLTVEK